MSGGGGGGGYQYMPQFTNNNSNTQNTLPDWLTNASKTGVSYAGNLLRNPGTPYMGELSPGLSSTQTLAGNLIQATNPGAYQSFWDSAKDYTNTAAMGRAPDINAQTYANGLSNIGQYMNPYISNVVDSTTALNKQNLDSALKQTADQAIGAKAFGGSRHGVQEGVATAQNNLGLTNAVSNLLAGGYSQAANMLGQDISNDFNAQVANQANANNTYNRALYAGNQMAGIGQTQGAADQQAINRLMQYGELEQRTNAAQDAAKYNEWLRQQGLPYQALQSYNSTVQGAPHDTTSNTTSSGWGLSPVQQQASSSPLMTGLGLGLTGMSMLGTGGMSGLGGLLGMATGLRSPFPSRGYNVNY